MINLKKFNKVKHLNDKLKDIEYYLDNNYTLDEIAAIGFDPIFTGVVDHYKRGSSKESRENALREVAWGVHFIEAFVLNYDMFGLDEREVARAFWKAYRNFSRELGNTYLLPKDKYDATSKIGDYFHTLGY